MAKAPKTASKATTSGSPFKTRKTREPQLDAGDVLTPPAEVAQAVDQFREFQEQAKHFEGEATIQKDLVMEYAQDEFCKRVTKGMNGSFKVLGEQTMVTYVVMDTSSGLTEEEVAAFAERWGDKAADELIVRDLASIRFDPEVLAANYDSVVEALQVLPKDVVENLFKPMLMKAKPGAVQIAKKYAKSPDELRDLITQLKMRNYIR